MKKTEIRIKLEQLYFEYNKREFVHPDPLEFLYQYNETKDREIAGIIASSLAYGRVKQILKSVDKILKIMGNSPMDFILGNNKNNMFKFFANFKHRFTKGEDIALMLTGVKQVIKKYGSIEKCFKKNLAKKDLNIINALEKFVKELTINFTDKANYLIPAPSRGSACKRLNLFLRWMVRSDKVDPGGWKNIPKSKLIIPLDTHMWQISQKLGFTNRKQANMKAALEITESFKTICPGDPVKYDFSLTRFGINDKLDGQKFLKEL